LAYNILYTFYYNNRTYESNNTRKFKLYNIIKTFIHRLKNNSLRNIMIKTKALKNKILSVAYIVIKDKSKSRYDLEGIKKTIKAAKT
jgi:hypothetical protein